MKLRNILLAVKDIEKSRQFYHELFGLQTVLNSEGNMILTEGLVGSNPVSRSFYWLELLDFSRISAILHSLKIGRQL